MKVLAILSQKGGGGKTTLSVHLAVAAEVAGRKASVIDLDPQASAAGWGDSRDSDIPPVFTCPPPRLQTTLDQVSGQGIQLTIIDTAPHAEAPALAAARAADLVLIPTRPEIFDLRAIGATIDIILMAGKPFAVVFNDTPPRGGRAMEASAAVKDQYQAPVCPVALVHRAVIGKALTLGRTAQEVEPDGKAAAEVTSLWKWVIRHLDTYTP